MGGMGAITQAMAKRARARAASRSGRMRRWRECIGRGGRARGCRARGRRGDRSARAWSPTSIRSCCSSAWSTSSTWTPTSARASPHYRCGSGTFRMNVALSELPDFTALPGTSAQTITAAASSWRRSLAYMERAYFDARTRRLVARSRSSRCSFRRRVDDTLAPPGMHVASLFCQHANPRLEAVCRAGRGTTCARRSRT